MNCINCPDNCINNEISTRCIYIEETGESLTSTLDKLRNQTQVSSTSKDINSDEITSKSIIRNNSSICGSNIIKRDFIYELEASQSNYQLSWDFLEIISNLPVGYKTGLVSFKATSNTGVVTNSKSYSGGISVSANSFPIAINTSIRVSSPCGDIDLSTEFTLNSSNTGTHRTPLSVKDLNPKSGQISLTEQLNNLESLVYELNLKINDLYSKV